MNTFGSWWDSTVTLYNKVESASGKITWYRPVLTECFYKHTAEKMTVDKTTISTDASICRIKVNDNYVNKRQYDALDDSEKVTHFTLAVGDIIVPEEAENELIRYCLDLTGGALQLKDPVSLLTKGESVEIS